MVKLIIMSLNKNNTLNYFLLLMSFLCYSQHSEVVTPNSKAKVESLDEVIVTATRTERQVSSLPLPALVIGKAEIESSNFQRLKDVINEQTGITTIPDYGGGEGVQLQGLDSEYTLILIDGVPLIGRLAGTFDLKRLSAGNIKQIEVVKGPSSSLYGNEALGGVINIITNTSKSDDVEGNISHRTGTFSTHDTAINLGVKSKQTSITGFINRNSSDGYNVGNKSSGKTVEPFINYTASAKVNYEFSKISNIVLSSRYFTQKQDYVMMENEGESNIYETNLQAKYNLKVKGWECYAEFYTTRYRTEAFLNKPNGNLYETSFYNQLMIRPEIRAQYNFNKNANIIIGTGFNHEMLNRTSFAAKPVFNTPYAYVQYDATIIDRLNLIIGARYDDHSKYKSQFSPKVAIRLDINDKLNFKSSVGYGFKAPAFRQLYFDFTNSSIGYTVLGYNAIKTHIPKMQLAGDIDKLIIPLDAFGEALKAENSIGINNGFNFKPIPELSIDFNYFQNLFTNLIDTQIIARKTNGQNVFSYVNREKVFTRGIECNVVFKPNNNLKFKSGYQLLYAKDKKVMKQFENGMPVRVGKGKNAKAFDVFGSKYYFGLPNRSRHMANFKVLYTYPKWNMDSSLRCVYRSKYGFADTNGNGHLDSYDAFIKGYSLWNLALSKTFSSKYIVGVGSDNILDFKNSKYISTIPGRIIYGRLNVKI